MNDFTNKLLRCCWMLLVGMTLSCSEDSGDDEVIGDGKQYGSPMEFKLHASENINIDEWSELADKRIAIAVDEEVKEFFISSTGELSVAEPFYTNGRDSVTVEAWYPYRKHKLYLPVVKANQHLEADYEASNHLEMPPTLMAVSSLSTRSADQALKLSLVRRTAKLECTLVKGEQADEAIDLGTASVSLLNMKGVEIGTTIHMNKQHRAYVYPQTLKAGTEFIRINFTDRDPYFCALANDVQLEAGQPYTLTITIGKNNGGIEVTITPSSTWDGSDEAISGSAPVMKEDGTNGSSWNEGNSSDTSGSSSTTDPSGTNGGNWNGSSSDTNGGSSTTDPSGTNGGNWNGNSSDANGNSSTTDPSGTNGGNWNGSSSDTSGNTPTTDPSGTNGGNWNGSSSDTSGNTPTTDPSGTNSGNWSGTSSDVTGTGTQSNGGTNNQAVSKKGLKQATYNSLKKN